MSIKGLDYTVDLYIKNMKALVLPSLIGAVAGFIIGFIVALFAAFTYLFMPQDWAVIGTIYFAASFLGGVVFWLGVSISASASCLLVEGREATVGSAFNQVVERLGCVVAVIVPLLLLERLVSFLPLLGIMFIAVIDLLIVASLVSCFEKGVKAQVFMDSIRDMRSILRRDAGPLLIMYLLALLAALIPLLSFLILPFISIYYAYTVKNAV